MKRAFTLAEVLITLGILGVIAAISLPTLITNVNERRNSERQANIAQKMTQAMEHMRALGKLTPYATTEDFVNELKNYIKITKICDKDHLTECWPSATIIDAEGNEYSVADAKTGAELGDKSLTTNNVGLILADGASIILNYDNRTEGYDVGSEVRGRNENLPVGGGNTKSFPYTTSVTDSIRFVMDVNGKNKPNRESVAGGKFYDIRSFRDARFSKGCAGIEVDGVGCIFVDTSTKKYFNEVSALCSSMGMDVPDLDTLNLIFQKSSHYPTLPQYGSQAAFYSKSTCNYGYHTTVAFWRGTANCNPNSANILCVRK